nr:hypothetical protein [Rhodococcus sp. 1R11]
MGRPSVDRVLAIDAARINRALEGACSTEATRADQDAYVRGEVDIAELGHRVRSRYGLS